MTIPRFNAQITQIQVPSMKNYQEDQNASIAKSLAQFGNDIFGISVQLAFAKNSNKQKQIKNLLDARGDIENSGGSKEDLDFINKQIIDLGGKV